MAKLVHFNEINKKTDHFF